MARYAECICYRDGSFSPLSLSLEQLLDLVLLVLLLFRWNNVEKCARALIIRNGKPEYGARCVCVCAQQHTPAACRSTRNEDKVHRKLLITFALSLSLSLLLFSSPSPFARHFSLITIFGALFASLGMKAI